MCKWLSSNCLLEKWDLALSSTIFKIWKPFPENPNRQLIANGQPKPYTQQYKASVQISSIHTTIPWASSLICIFWILVAFRHSMVVSYFLQMQLIYLLSRFGFLRPFPCGISTPDLTLVLYLGQPAYRSNPLWTVPEAVWSGSLSCFIFCKSTLQLA